MRNFFVGFAVAAVLVACSPSDIKATDYDQSCAVDGDCVQVTELEAVGTTCSMGCTTVAINEKEKARYDEDLADAEGKCGSMASPFCDSTGTPVCVKGRCEVRPE